MNDRSLFVPASGAELTSDWLHQALQVEFPNVSFRSVTIERVGEGYGLASCIFRCRLVGSDAPPSVVVKLWSTEGPGGTREVDFYRTFAPRLGARIPAGYYGAVDDERWRGVLVLEDLGDVLQGDVLEQLTIQGAERLAREIASLHATWWDGTELHEANWLRSLRTFDRGPDWYEPRRELFIQRFGDRLDPFARQLLENVMLLQVRANERLAGVPVTLLHAELHLDNVVFEGPSKDPVLLDWAKVAIGPAAIDLAEILFAIGPPEGRDRVLNTYLEALCEGGVTDFDEASLRHQLGGGLLRKFIVSTYGVARWQPDSEREEEMIDVSLQRTFRAVKDWRERDPDLFLF